MTALSVRKTVVATAIAWSVVSALIASPAAFMVVPRSGRKRPGAAKPPAAKQWTPPRTSWGDPDLSGVFSNADEYSLPFEQPQEFDGRRLEDVTQKELAEIRIPGRDLGPSR